MGRVLLTCAVRKLLVSLAKGSSGDLCFDVVSYTLTASARSAPGMGTAMGMEVASTSCMPVR